MFGHLTQFGYQRTPVQALGFYLVYLIGGTVVSAAVSAVAAPIFGASGFEEGMAVGVKVGAVVAVLLSGALFMLVLRAKGLLGHVGYLLVGLLSVMGGAVAGLLLGLIFVAFLTTRPASSLVDAAARPIEQGDAL